MGKERARGSPDAGGRDGGGKFLFDGGRGGGGEGKERGEVFIHRPHQGGIETNVNRRWPNKVFFSCKGAE